MAYSELVQSFFDLDVIDYNSADDWQGPGRAYRLREEYDDETTIEKRLNSLLQNPDSQKITAVLIGAWSASAEGDGSEKIVQQLCAVASSLPALKALYFGEMTYEECEISWINQSDMTPLLNAFPLLDTFRVRGGTALAFSKTSHANLRVLAIETGGLPSSVLREIFLCDFPNLQHLELLLGESNYGFDGTVEDLQPLMAGKIYPKLTYLGLMNSEIANDIAAVVVNAPIVNRIQTLDLSMGNLDIEGVRSLHRLAQNTSLKTLNISHHFVAQDLIEDLRKALRFNLIAEDPQEAEDEWRPIVHAE